MPIRFIPNDPMAAGSASIQIAPHPGRPPDRVDFAVPGLPVEQVYPLGGSDFVHWQAREAALAALDVFEAICGPLTGWTGRPSKRTLDLLANVGPDLNAYYDRDSVSFFEGMAGSKTVFSGASTDVVAHEVGHAILDALRPDLWNANTMEIAAFHEGLGDCVAIMLALSYRDLRLALLAADPDLTASNFVETTAEELSDAIAMAVGPNHNAAVPRRALNTFQWLFPGRLPSSGHPGQLINEEHSFGQLVSGCYYDLIRAIFAGSGKTEGDLWDACREATRLLIDGVRNAPIRPRFVETVGRTMLVNDLNAGGQHQTAIRNAFANHGFRLSANSFLAPKLDLQASLAAVTGASDLAQDAVDALRSVLSVGSDAAVFLRSVDLALAPVVEATVRRAVDLTGLSERLEGVVAFTPQTALVGEVEGSAAVLGAVDAVAIVSNEVRTYVATLLERGAIAFDDDREGASSGGGGAGYLSGGRTVSHVVVREGGQAVLERRAFVCRCCARSA